MSLKALSLAVTCPGQGIVTRGCLSAVRKYQPIFQQTLDCVDQVFGEPVSEILLENPPSVPDLWSLATSNAQPAIVASTYALVQILRDVHDVDLTTDKRVSFFLGHSLGEYTALLLAGVLTLPQALGVVRKRGLLMENIVKEKNYEMRVLMFRPALYDRVHKIASERQVLACANNSTQILISGEPAVLDAVIEELNTPRKTVLKLAKLPVKIPFHNRIIEEIEPELRKLVPDSVKASQAASKPVVSNYTGDISQGDLFANTVDCNSTPVQWKNSMELLEKYGVSGVINLGPGNAVDAINAKFSLPNYAVKTEEDMQKLADLLKAE